MKTVFILGAGFSIPAGYPSAKKLNERFFNSVEDKLLRFSSSEWAWDEYGDAASNNGRLNYDFLNISYLLSELVEQYQQGTYEIFDYESFYDWFSDRRNDIPFMQRCCETVNNRLKGKVIENSSHFFKKADINQHIEINKCYNYLIADLLERRYDREEKYLYYKNFVNLINEKDEIDIFTLNHDLLVEFLLSKSNIRYSDGFSLKDSCIIGSNDERLPVFNNVYTQNVRLLKLHGSVDYFLFRKMDQTNNYLADTGDYWFFKPGGYDNKHDAKRIDLTTGKIVQDFNFEIIPQFLVGKRKPIVINSHLIYKRLFEHLEKSLAETQNVIIIGYSYHDNHINDILKNAIDKFNFQLLNVNPNTEFPFRKNYTRDFVKEFKDIQELSF